ncbi:DUF1810 domain-containing protein [Ruixingdingia sedimenti]|uniref:DUF1810 family protein n=1 Tax=Ruixingdingia sedimenti TaxID=3073604 RepID=A0ABU1F7N3_9RHOB|nr:DUF1810 family protein [Xinfangfangia sp. LG-4]MDR5652886.1 DUF1810 family protein [Xinfangfangia sp. LG-4]
MPGLGRFIAAQDPVMDAVMAELRAGRKATHWMWFVFPQLASLGRSGTARFYGLADPAEARAYLAHPVLRARLLAAAEALLAHRGLTAQEILGPTDAMKLRSCATLFAAAGDAEVTGRMEALLARFYDGVPCPLTQKGLAQDG